VHDRLDEKHFCFRSAELYESKRETAPIGLLFRFNEMLATKVSGSRNH